MYEQQHKRILALVLGIVVFGALIAGLILLFRGYGEETAEPVESPRAVFSEVMSSNGSFAGPDGELYDWIELYNPHRSPADLSGWGLSDRADEIKFVFPDGASIPGGGYLVVWCSKTTDRDDMAPFALASQGGESLYLFDPQGEAAEELALPELKKDSSWQLCPDGQWAATLTPTPGEANVLTLPPEAERAETDGVISELMAAGRINPAAMITHIGGLNAVCDTVINLPSIPGGKKLIYTHKDMPLVAIADFAKLGESDPFYKKLAEIVAANNMLWCAEAEKYVLANAKDI